MAHHAYLATGDLEASIGRARSFAERELGLSGTDHPDIIVLRYGHFPVEEARRIVDLASRAALGEHRLIVIAAERLFHEAQNALLKAFEEPPQGTVIVLAVPTEGQVIATMRSRLLLLPEEGEEEHVFHPFVAATPAERAKLVEKLLARSKSDKDEEKQAARAEALRIVGDVTRAAHREGSEKHTQLLRELDRFTPILHERSAPLKLVFEHLLLVIPDNLVR